MQMAVPAGPFNTVLWVCLKYNSRLPYKKHIGHRIKFSIQKAQQPFIAI